MSLTIRPVSYALGAEVQGLNCLDSMSEADFAELRQAFLTYGVLVFRGLPITTEQHLTFSRRFGELDKNELVIRDTHPEHREVLLNTNRPRPGAKPLGPGAMIWHSDRTYSCSPASATLLHAIEIPDIGGDTMLANMYLAYATLSDGMKKLLQGMCGIHPGAKRVIDDSTPQALEQSRRLSRPVAHPVVRQHPETGRAALYVGPKVKQLVGLTPQESQSLLGYLCAHAARDQFVYRHRWQKGDLLMWDNRCTLHLAVGDFDRSQWRHIEKTCVVGAPSGGYFHEEAG